MTAVMERTDRPTLPVVAEPSSDAGAWGVEDAACRAVDTRPQWWSHDAGKRGRRVAARLCGGCPVLAQCDELRRDLGPAAAGTWAGVFQPYTDVASTPDDLEVAEIAAALDWEGRYGGVL